jgi:hypothetical protein
MTTEELAKLDAIEARIRELLDIASKRTPGRWERVRTHLGTRGYPYTIVESKKAKGHNYRIETPNSYDAIVPCVSLENSAFIASAAGPFEAALRTTLGDIEAFKIIALVDYTGLGTPVPDESYLGRHAAARLRTIITEWEGCCER